MASENGKTNYYISSLLRKLQSSSASSVQKALISLSRATRKPDNVVKLRQEGGIDSLLTFLKSSNKKALDMAVSVLANCALEKQSRTEIKERNGLVLLCNLLASLADTSILSRVTRAMANLSQEESIGQEISNLDTIPKLLEILKESSDVPLLQNTLRALRIMSKTYACTTVLAKENRLLIFVELLHKENGNEIKRCCLRTLFELTKATNGNLASHVKQHGGIQAACQFSYSDDEEIKEHCINILCTLTEDTMVRVSVGILGGIEAFIHQIRARGPLLFLSIKGLCRCCREAVNRNKVRSCGGLELLLDILRCAEYSKAFDNILGGFACFTYDDVALKYLIANGLIPILVSILHKQLFPENKDAVKKQEDAVTTRDETKAISTFPKNTSSKLFKLTGTATTLSFSAISNSRMCRTLPLPLFREIGRPASPPSCISPNLSPELRLPSSYSPESERSSSPMVYSPSGSEADDNFSSESDSNPEEEKEDDNSAPSQDLAPSKVGKSKTAAFIDATISSKSSSTKEEAKDGGSYDKHFAASNENVLSTLMEDLATTHSGGMAMLGKLDEAFRHGRPLKDEEKRLLRLAYERKNRVHLLHGAGFSEHAHLFLRNENLFSADQPSPFKVPPYGNDRHPGGRRFRSRELPTSKKPDSVPWKPYTNGLETIEGKIIFLLSRFGQMPDVADSESLISAPCIQILFDYLCYYKDPDSRCERLFSRLVWDRKCFEKLIVIMFPGALYRQLVCGLRPAYLLSDQAAQSSSGTEFNEQESSNQTLSMTTSTVVNEPLQVMPFSCGSSSTFTDKNATCNSNLGSCASVILHQPTSASNADSTQTFASQDAQASTSETMQASTSETMQASTSETMQASTSETMQASTSDTMQASTPETMQASSSETMQASTLETMQASTSETMQASTSEPMPASSSETMQASTPETMQASTSETMQASTSETMQASTSETMQASTSETMQASTSETMQASTSEPMPASSSETMQASTSETMQASTPETMQASTSETMQASTSETMQASTSDTMQASTSDTIQAPISNTIQPLQSDSPQISKSDETKASTCDSQQVSTPDSVRMFDTAKRVANLIESNQVGSKSSPVLTSGQPELNLVSDAAKDSTLTEAENFPRNITKYIGSSLISVLNTQAESSFGEGILTHLLLRGTQKQKEACALSLPYVCTKERMKRKLLIDCKGIMLILSILCDSTEQADIARAVHSITYLIANSALKIENDFSVFIAKDEREFLFPRQQKIPGKDPSRAEGKNRNDMRMSYYDCLERERFAKAKNDKRKQRFDPWSRENEERLSWMARETDRSQRGEEYDRLISMMSHGGYNTATKRLRRVADRFACKRTKVEFGSSEQETDGNCCYDRSHSTPFDVVVKLDTGESIEAHRSVLCAFSDVFAAMLSSDFMEANQSEVVIKELSHTTAIFLVHYAYGCRWSVHERAFACPLLEGSLSADNPPSCDNPPPRSESLLINSSLPRDKSPSSKNSPTNDRFKFDFDFLVDLLACADRFLLTVLKKQCEQLMMYGLTGDNVVDAYRAAVYYNTSRLRVYSLQHIFLENVELKCVYDCVMKLLQSEERETVIEDFKNIAMDCCS